jgi:hypothetical protein
MDRIFFINSTTGVVTSLLEYKDTYGLMWQYKAGAKYAELYNNFKNEDTHVLCVQT